MKRLLYVLPILLAAAAALAQPMTLAIDASEAPRGILHARMSIPAAPGAATLLYPKWIPGEHGPTGPLVNLVNVQIHANGQRVDWRRDPVDMFAFHLDVPAGASSLDVTADFLLPAGGQFTAGRAVTSTLGVISWNHAVLYLRGKPADEIMVRPSLRIPSGWKFATALPVARTNGDTIEFAESSLATVVDSPVQIGVHQSIVKLREADGRPHEIALVADSRAELEAPPEFDDFGNNLVTQAGLLFGGRHYRSYKWLLTLSEGVAHFGLEHHESSDNRLAGDALATARGQRGIYSLLAHEYVHSWCGKYRRPANMISPDFTTPMHGELLWVYEGLTTYLGNVLTARSAGWTPEMFRERLAATAADLESQTGRTWRPLADTAVEAQVLFGAPSAWWSLRRGVDFYDESIFVWLDVDTTIRELSGGKRSLDDFTSRFFGGLTGPMVKTFTFDDIVTTLNGVQPHDWRAFLNARLQSLEAHAPLGGLTRSGWRLEFNDQPNAALTEYEEGEEQLNLRSTLGMHIGKDGAVRDVAPGTPAYAAGLSPGFTIIAVNGRKYTPTVLRNALKAKEPVELIAQNGEFFAVHRIDYRGGMRYPHLVRDASKPDLLTAIISKR